MKSSRLRRLKAVEGGDVIFAVDARNREWLLFVHKTTTSSIFARHVTSQTEFEFGRDGHSKERSASKCVVVSTRPLPPTEYGVVLGLERKTRLGQDPDGHLLSKDETRVILKSGDYFKARPLVDGEEPAEMPQDAKPAAFD